MASFPTLFLSHESPYLWDTPSPARDFLLQLGRELPQPRAILVVSAHWENDRFTVSAANSPKTLHDFGGFPDRYREIHYPAPGAPELAVRTHELLTQQGVDTTIDPNRGLDHAVWLPIGLIYPRAEIPVLSMSVKFRGTTEEHFLAGKALSSLRKEQVLIVGSGTATHDLSGFFGGRRPGIEGPPDQKALEFNQWLINHSHSPDEVMNYRRMAPHAATCHPTAEHFLPFIVAMGAGNSDPVSVLHESFNYSHFAMTQFAWGHNVNAGQCGTQLRQRH